MFSVHLMLHGMMNEDKARKIVEKMSAPEGELEANDPELSAEDLKVLNDHVGII